MIRRPPRSTLFSLHDALPIFLTQFRLTAWRRSDLAHPLSVHTIRPGKMAWLTGDRKSTRLNSSHLVISYAVFCLKKKTDTIYLHSMRPLASVWQQHATYDIIS